MLVYLSTPKQKNVAHPAPDMVASVWNQRRFTEHSRTVIRSCATRLNIRLNKSTATLAQSSGTNQVHQLIPINLRIVISVVCTHYTLHQLVSQMLSEINLDTITYVNTTSTEMDCVHSATTTTTENQSQPMPLRGLLP